MHRPPFVSEIVYQDDIPQDGRPIAMMPQSCRDPVKSFDHLYETVKAMQRRLPEANRIRIAYCLQYVCCSNCSHELIKRFNSVVPKKPNFHTIRALHTYKSVQENVEENTETAAENWS